MAAPPPNNPLVAKVIMTFASDTRIFQNVFHVSNVTAWTAINLAQLATDFISWWNGFYKTRMSSDIALTLVQTRRLDPSLPLGVDQPVIPPSPGGAANVSVPSNATSTISWRTGLAGRRFRGRTYVPGITVPDVNANDSITSALVNQLLSAGVALITSSLSAGKLTVFHAPDTVPTPFDNTFTDVTTAVIENLLDSQKRRLPGRGR